MTTLALNKYDYAMYYPVTGLRVRGKLGGICIFKEYWYGRRVDKLYAPYEPCSPKQQALWAYFAAGVAAWQAYPAGQKAEFNRLANPYRLYGYHRFLSQYMKLRTPLIG